MLTIRPETSADYAAVYAVNKLAFDNRDAEPQLVEAIRNAPEHIPELSLVAVEAGKVVGHILFSLVHVETPGGDVPILALAPMAVLPDHQKRGIGSALVRHGLERCRQLGYTIVNVLGHPDYYPRFGFSAALARNLGCPYGDCGEAWMALELVPGALTGVRGMLRYPKYFEGV